MKNLQYEQFRVIANSSPDLYTEELNRAMKELKGKSPRVEFHAADPFVAYIRYIETETVPESLADEYALKGIRFTCCEDCSQIEGLDDGRRRYYECRYKTRIRYGDRACEEFYRKDARGDKSWKVMR